MPRPTKAIINRTALKHNCRYLKKLISPAKFMAVIKANAYGHGAVYCATAIDTLVDGFAVAFLEEAIELRRSNIKKTILVLEGFFDLAELQSIIVYKLDIVIHSFEQINILTSCKLSSPINIWLKFDSGMGRLGFSPKEYQQAWEILIKIPKIDNIILMSHFSVANNIGSSYTQKQLLTFNSHTAHLPGLRSFCNSAATISLNNNDDWKRIGLLLYGISPFTSPHKIEADILPVMQLKSSIISCKKVAAGEKIGYGGLYVTKRETILGVVAIGYADGYPRYSHRDAFVIINKKRSPLIGQVSMDMLTVDLTEIPDAKVGDEVLLWGNELSVTEVAKWSGVIPWQLLCNVNRVKIEYQ